MNNNINGHKCIVFNADFPNTLGIVRSLGEKGIEPILIIFGEPKLAAKSKYPSALHCVADIDAAYKLLIEKYSNEEQKPFLFTCCDSTTFYINERYNELEDKFIFYNCGENGRLCSLAPKLVQNQLAKESGLLVANCEVVKVGELPQMLKYPVITKATSSLGADWKTNVFICQNPDELKSAYTHIKEKEVLVQEFIEKDTEMPIQGISINHGEDVYMPLQMMYNRTFKDSFGYTFRYEKFSHPEMLEPMKAFFKKMGFEGVFEIEFIVGKDGKFYFLELNMRSSAWNHSSTDAGFNLPYTWAKSMIKGQIDDSEIKDVKLPVHCLVEFDDIFGSVMGEKYPLFKWLRESFQYDSYVYWDRHDVKPFLKKSKDFITIVLKRIFRF